MTLYFLVIIGGFWSVIILLFISQASYKPRTPTLSEEFKKELLKRNTKRWWEDYKRRNPTQGVE